MFSKVGGLYFCDIKIFNFYKEKLHRNGGEVMTKEQTLKEIEYKMSLKLLKILLNRGIIDEEEFEKIDELNRQSFSPELSEVYV